MKRKITCLKERRELYNHSMTLEEYRKICRNYGEKLESEGWKLSVIEGGCISPDMSTIYIYFRDPYEGELLNFIPNTEEQYEKICKEFINKKDFIFLQPSGSEKTIVFKHKNNCICIQKQLYL